jgi:hypothetical protein
LARPNSCSGYLGLVGIAAGGVFKAHQVHRRAVQAKLEGVAIQYYVEFGHAVFMGAQRGVVVIVIMLIVGMRHGQGQQGEGQCKQQTAHGQLQRAGRIIW